MRIGALGRGEVLGLGGFEYGQGTWGLERGYVGRMNGVGVSRWAR